MANESDTLRRIESALSAASDILREYTPGAVAASLKADGDPVTEADERVNRLLLESLPRGSEGWLSEETKDGPERRRRSRVWIVDPLDGTREFIEGIPEWCISIGLVEDGRPIAGGICNPATGEVILGSAGTGVTLNGRPAAPSRRDRLEGATVLASRSEIRRGEWNRFGNRGFIVRPCGSVAYKLALVAAGLADATWTLTPKHEWDVAAGAALLLAAGGDVLTLRGEPPLFNRADVLLDGLVCTAPGLTTPVRALLEIKDT